MPQRLQEWGIDACKFDFVDSRSAILLVGERSNPWAADLCSVGRLSGGATYAPLTEIVG